MNNRLTFFLALFNTLLLIILFFWLVNKDCSLCQQEMPLTRIFTFKDKCLTCEEASHE